MEPANLAWAARSGPGTLQLTLQTLLKRDLHTEIKVPLTIVGHFISQRIRPKPYECAYLKIQSTPRESTLHH